MDLFIKLPDGTKVSVTQEVHEAYYDPERREEYHERMKKKLHRSYDELSGSEHPAEEQLFAPMASTEELAEREMTLEILLYALGQLTTDERELVKELYVRGKSEREYERSIGVPRKTMAYRRERVLAKIRKLLAG